MTVHSRKSGEKRRCINKTAERSRARASARRQTWNSSRNRFQLHSRPHNLHAERDGSLFSLCDYSKTLLVPTQNSRTRLTRNVPNRKAERVAWAPRENSGAIVAILRRGNAFKRSLYIHAISIVQVYAILNVRHTLRIECADHLRLSATSIHFECNFLFMYVFRQETN